MLSLGETSILKTLVVSLLRTVPRLPPPLLTTLRLELELSGLPFRPCCLSSPTNPSPRSILANELSEAIFSRRRWEQNRVLIDSTNSSLLAPARSTNEERHNVGQGREFWWWTSQESAKQPCSGRHVHSAHGSCRTTAPQSLWSGVSCSGSKWLPLQGPQLHSEGSVASENASGHLSHVEPRVSKQAQQPGYRYILVFRTG